MLHHFSRTLLLLTLLVGVPSGCKAAVPVDPAKKAEREKLRKVLTEEQFRVTQENGTETPYDNAYWDHHDEGIYVDVVSGEPLFSSLEKYDSKTGWPSFYKPLVDENIVQKAETGFMDTRIEVRSKKADSHLGHVFTDGPKPTGLRYCINSASLKFIPADKLVESGYPQFVPLFKKKAAAATSNPATESIVLAGGCFWGVEAVFERVKGVLSATSGYTGGTLKDPTYKAVSSGDSGHAEAVQVVYDPAKVKLETLLKVFFDVAHDPTELNRQGPDIGTQYRSAIYYSSDAQKQIINAEVKRLAETKAFNKPIVTQIEPLGIFYKAEDEHQGYYDRNPTQPYIVIHDKPKVAMLQKKYPDLFVAKPQAQ